MSGKRLVSRSVWVCVALLGATAAGRVDEGNSGVMRVAPELLQPRHRVIACGSAAEPESRQIVFEMLQPGEPDDLPRILAGGSREGVAFEWNAATRELTLSGTRGAMFSDLETAATRNASLVTRSCESR